MQATLEKVGGYELIGRIAAGGMAEVFLARRSGAMGFEKFLVVKRILPHLAAEQEFVTMFLDEARIAAAINHPNVVQIYDLGEDGGTYFIVMEYLEGQSLSAIIKRCRRQRMPPGWAYAARVVAEAAAGLHAAHELRSPTGEHIELVHRDVSPQNILVLYSGGVKLVDFGVAKARGRLTQTTSRALKGKYGYMSPEQALGHPLDRRSDVFALGIVLWEALALKRLYHSESELAILKAITERKPPPPSKYNPYVPSELEEITMRALAKDPGARYESADDLKRALERCMAQHSMTCGSTEIHAWLRGLFAEEIERSRSALAAAARGEVRNTNRLSLFEVLSHEAGSGSGPSAVSPAPTGTQPGLGGVPARALEPAPPAVFEGSTAEDTEGEGLAPEDRGPRGPAGTGPQSRPTIPTGYELEERLAAKSGLSQASGEVQSALMHMRRRARVGRLALVAAAVVAAGGGVGAWWLLRGDPSGADGDGLGSVAATARALKLGEDTSTAMVELGSIARAIEASTAEPGTAADPATAAPEAAAGSGGAASAATAGDLPESAEPLPPDGPAAGKRAPAAAGWLNLDTIPWSEVYLGKRKLGITPLVKVRLTAGTHKLLLVNKKAGVSKTTTVTIKGGKVTREKVKL